jgi:hypothetical protein
LKLKQIFNHLWTETLSSLGHIIDQNLKIKTKEMASIQAKKEAPLNIGALIRSMND